MSRLFIAIDLGHERSKSLAQLRNDSLDARWVPIHQYHLTLRFIGDADDEAGERLMNNLEQVTVPEFKVQGAGMDVFPSRRQPRVLVARIDRHPILMQLHEAIDDVVLRVPFLKDRKPFNPHVTIARLKNVRPKVVREYMKQHAGFRLNPFVVDRFHLFRSDLRPGGAVHTVLKSYPLRDSVEQTPS